MVSEVTPREIAVPCACYIIGSVWQRELITPRTQSLTLPVNPRDLASRSSLSELCVWCVVCVVGFAGGEALHHGDKAPAACRPIRSARRHPTCRHCTCRREQFPFEGNVR